MQGAGLGAMLQAKGSSSGVSKQSMNELMAKARDLPDSELADVLAGKSMAVPQFAAMLAAMGRRSLRTAVAGAQAGQAKQPSEKDKLLADMQGGQAAGLAAVPAPNMEQMGEGMAAGGIVAFDNGGPVDFSKIPTNELTEEQFNALPESERMQRIYGSKRDSSAGVGTFLKGVPATAAALLGATTATPFLAGARAVLPESVTSKLPTVGDLFGDKGATGILKQYVKKAGDEYAADIEAQVRKSLRTYDPVAEGASPGAQDPKFVGGQTGGGAYVGYRKQRTPGSGTPKSQPPALPQQDTSRLAFDYEEPTVLPTTVVRGDSTPEGSLTEGVTPASVAASEAQLPKTIASPGGSAPAGTGPARTGAGAPKAGLDALTAARAEAPAGRKSPIDDLIAPLDEIRKQVASGKEQAQGEFLMTLGARIMRTPNLGAAIGQGIQEGLPGLAANRKEANMLLKDQRDYNLNLAKAKEAAAQGRDDLAFKYADLAEKAQYHAGVIGVGMARAGSSEKLDQQLRIAAARLTQSDWEKHEKALGIRANKITPEQKNRFMQESYLRNLGMLQGQFPTMQDSRVVSELPKGADVLSRD